MRGENWKFVVLFYHWVQGCSLGELKWVQGNSGSPLAKSVEGFGGLSPSLKFLLIFSTLLKIPNSYQ